MVAVDFKFVCFERPFMNKKIKSSKIHPKIALSCIKF